MTTVPKRKALLRRLKKACFLKRLLGLDSNKRALKEIAALLSRSDLTALAHEDIDRIKTKHCVEDEPDFFAGLRFLYRDYLRLYLRDHFLSTTNARNLIHLKSLLSIDDDDAANLHDEVAGAYYKKVVDKTIEDGRMDEDKRNYLNKIRNGLRLSTETANRIFQESAHELLYNRTRKALARERLSAEEEKELEAIRKSLDIDHMKEGRMRADYEKYKLFWQIENGRLPVFESDIDMSLEEPCHFYTHAEWLEQKVSIGEEEANALMSRFSSPQKWKVEDRELQPTLEDVWATLDNGKMYLTKRKILLAGEDGDKSIDLDKIVDFAAFKNGALVVERQRSIFIQFKDHIDIFSMIIGKCIAQRRNRIEA